MNVLVTGGAGFIGSHICERLIAQGNRITILDDLNTFYSPLVKRANVAAILEKNSSATFIQCDICNDGQLGEIVTMTKPQVIIHLAARAGVRQSVEQPGLYEHVNVGGTVSVLEAARRGAVERLIFASSSAVYGAATAIPFRETACIQYPISPYAATKSAGEQLCFTYSYLYGLKIICLRFFTVYGPRQRPDLAISKFTRAITAGQPIRLYGEASARDYTYVDDIVDGVMAAIDQSRSYEVINLGSGRPIGIRQVVKSLEGVLERRAIIQVVAPEPGDVPETCADVGKAELLLGYKPLVSFEEGIKIFVAWYKAVGS
jgi:UDP-glucuronate 4-epimerase